MAISLQPLLAGIQLAARPPCSAYVADRGPPMLCGWRPKARPIRRRATWRAGGLCPVPMLTASNAPAFRSTSIYCEVGGAQVVHVAW